MPSDILDDLAEVRARLASARGTLKGLDEETLKGAADWLEQMAVEVAKVERVVAGRLVRARVRAEA
jgi:hypothetical protein